MLNLGFYNTSGTRTHVRFPFSTHASAGGNVAPNSAFEAADLRIYKATDGAAFSATQRSSANGVTVTSPFDSLTGVHDVDIDLTDNTDASFYASGCAYIVMLCPDETVDGQTITGIPLGYWEIGPQPVNTTHWGGTAVASANVLIDGAITAAKIASDAITSSKVADGFLTAAKFASGAFDAVWSVATRLLTAGTNIVLAKGTGVTGFNDLDAAGVRTAVGLASADLDTQLGALPTAAEIVAAQLTTAITESYRTNGSAPTLAQFMSEVLAHMGEATISGTTKTVNQLDHSTPAMTFTLDDATNPSSITRAS